MVPADDIFIVLLNAVGNGVVWDAGSGDAAGDGEGGRLNAQLIPQAAVEKLLMNRRTALDDEALALCGRQVGDDRVDVREAEEGRSGGWG